MRESENLLFCFKWGNSCNGISRKNVFKNSITRRRIQQVRAGRDKRDKVIIMSIKCEEKKKNSHNHKIK